MSPAPVVSTLVVSGKTPERVASWAGALADWMDGPGAQVPLADVAHTLNHHRARHAKFGAVCARDHADAVSGLRALAAGQPAVGVVLPHEGRRGRRTVFVYSGQGSQWAGMGRQLLADEPVFAAAVAELEPVFVAATGFSLREVLANSEPVTGIERIQPVLVGVQLALTALWRSYGVEPDAVIGHSMGEVSAAVVAGALTAAEGLRVIATRSRLMARLAGRGAMALLELDAAGAEALIADYPQVTVAVYASPRQTVIAGPPDDIDTLIAAVAAQDRLARRVEVDVASHHPIIDPILADLRAALADLAPCAPSIPIISTVDGAGATPVFDAEHWAANLRNPVRFGAGRRHRRRHRCHVRRNQPAPAADPRHHRHRGHRTRHLGNAAGPGPDRLLPHPARRRRGTIGRHRLVAAPSSRTAPGTTPTTGSPPPQPRRWERIPCWAWVSRIRRTAPGCGKAHSARTCSGSATIASTTRACCPGRHTPNSRSPPRPTPSEPMVTSPGRSVSFAWIR